MKKFLFVIAAAAAVLFSACNKESFSDDIVGTWSVVGYRYMEDGQLDIDNESEGVYITFYSDGTCVNENGMNVKWKISGSTLTMTFDGESVKFKIRTLTSTDLVLRMEYDSKNWEEMICVKI